jgi:hypothetical protein
VYGSLYLILTIVMIGIILKLFYVNRI